MRDMFSKKLQNEEGGGGGVEGRREGLGVQGDEGQRKNKFRELQEKLEIKREPERCQSLASMCLSCSDKT